MIPKSTDVFCGDLADNQLFYRDSYTFYQASPSLELTQDTFGCLPMSSTPNRAQRSTQSLWPSIPAYWDTYPITTSPRALVTPSTSSISTANMQLVFSPSPLPLSQVPSLVYPDISPPSQGSGSTPFERQFVGDFPREWNSVNTQISPVARRNPHSSFLSPTFSNAGGTPSRAVYGSTSQDFQDAAGRVSLIDKFISAAADESATSKNDTPLLTFTSQNRCSSPLSNLSELTPLSSPESSDRFGRGFDLRSSSPPTSPTVEGPKDPRESSIQYTPNSEREPSPSQSTRSLSRDSDYQPAKGTAGYKRKRASRSRDGDETPIKRRKIRTTSVPETPSADTNPSFEILTRRRLPTNIPFHAQFPLFYLRFPVSSYLRLADGMFVQFISSQFGECSRSNASSRFPLLSADSKRVPGTYNEPRDGLDLYTPRFVKGCGATKVGVCPICIESPSRGGKGEVVWLSMKFSAYKWHVSQHVFTSPAYITPLTELCFYW